MNDALPEPLVAGDVDLRNFPFTPIFRARLFGSSFHAHASDAEWRAGVTLWLKSWDQNPSGTLPDNDVDLCRLAELGRDLKLWAKLKGGALRGWLKCADGRLHHPVVAEGINEAWNSRLKQCDRTAAARAARLSQRHSMSVTASVTDDERAPVTHTVTGSNRTKQNRTEGEEDARATGLSFSGKVIKLGAEQIASCKTVYPRDDMIGRLTVYDAKFVERAQIPTLATILSWLQRDAERPVEPGAAPSVWTRAQFLELPSAGGEADADAVKTIAAITSRWGAPPPMDRNLNYTKVLWALHWKGFCERGLWLDEWGERPERPSQPKEIRA